MGQLDKDITIDSGHRVRPTHLSQTPVKFPKLGEAGGIEKGAGDAAYLIPFINLKHLTAE